MTFQCGHIQSVEISLLRRVLLSRCATEATDAIRIEHDYAIQQENTMIHNMKANDSSGRLTVFPDPKI